MTDPNPYEQDRIHNQRIPTLSQASQQPTHKDPAIAQDQMQATIVDTSTAALEHDIVQVDAFEDGSSSCSLRSMVTLIVKNFCTLTTGLGLPGQRKRGGASTRIHSPKQLPKLMPRVRDLKEAQSIHACSQSFPRRNRPTQGDPAIIQSKPKRGLPDPERGLIGPRISFGQGEASNMVPRMRYLKEAQSIHALSQSFSKPNQPTQGDPAITQPERGFIDSTISAQDQNFYLSPSIQGHSIPAVLEPPQLDPVAILSSTPSMGQDGTFKEVWDFLKDDKVGMAGIYGMGGIGKTTLLKRINNELQGTCDFDVVILVVVSKEVSMDKIQKAILEKLGLPHYDENVNDQVVIFKALRRRKFLLLLDDLWEGLDLVKLGIPAPCDQNRSKVLFTTRYEDICDKMLSSRKIKVNCMSREEVWDLFRENVGEEVLDAHPNIPNLAHKVAEKCKGLPLAVKVIARAMTCKMTIQEWKDALNTLCNVPYEISGTEKDLYYFVKFSYDMLPNKAIQNCFLYCTLFPQDYPIDEEELIKYWMEEGFLDGCENIDEVVNKGNHVIVTLKALCLLESVTDCVKMHDVIREMALLIASECVVNSGKFLVKSGIGLCEAPEAEKWRETQRISLMANEIIELPETPMCPKLMTLMLQRNNCLRISENFFQFMPLLRVLDLSNTGLRMLPGSISELVTLQYLNLSGTYLERVPKEIGDLQSLRCLDMSNILKMPPFPPEVTSRPSKLVYHILISQFSIFDPEYDESNISGLERLEFLYDLSICIRNFSSLMYLFGSQKLGQCITNLWIFLCGDMKCLQLTSFGSRLRTLHIGPCDSLEDIEVGGETSLEREYQILPRLEVLRVEYNYNLKKILVCNSLGQCLRRLTTLVIDGCWLLENIGWVKYLKSLEYLKVRVNYVLEELFSSQNEVEEGPITFPKLKQLRIVDLRELKRICGDVVAFPSLESLKVYGCPNLKKLPLGLLNENRTLRTIGGDEGWWCSLEWSDGVKSRFQPYFRNRQR